MIEMDELRTLSTMSKRKRGRLDAQTRARVVKLLGSAFVATDALKVILPLSEDLQSDVIADALGGVWKDVADDRQRSVNNWLLSGTGERATRRRVLVALALAPIEPETALQLLNSVLLRNGPLTKETIDLTLANMFGNKPFDFQGFAIAISGSSESLALYLVLLKIALDRNHPIDVIHRYKTIQGCLYLTAKRPTGDRVWEDVLPRIEAEIRRWTTQLRSSLRSWVKDTCPQIESDIFGNSPSSSLPAAVVLPSGGSVNSNGPLEVLLQSVDKRLENISLEHKDLQLMRELIVKVNSAMDARNDRENALQMRLDRLLPELDAAKTALGVAQQALHTSQERLATSEAESNAREGQLKRQIEAKAAASLEEFSNRLAGRLSRLIVDLPSSQTQMTPELGRVVLLQFHHFLDEMDRLGIAINRKRG